MTESGKPRVVGFNHVALEVGDIEEALAFYGRVFDFTLRSKSASMAFIDLGRHREGQLLRHPRGPRAGHSRRWQYRKCELCRGL